jgi:CPA2 family monovalent cation:H+ antiporter-2
MMVEPKILVEYAVPIAVLVMAILIGQSVFGTFSFMLAGESLKSAMRCGFSMAQIGEFSFIIASLGLSLGVISDFLYPVVVAVSVTTTFLTPYMIRLATPVYNHLEHHLPNKLINTLNSLSMTTQQHTSNQNHWKKLLTQMTVNTVVYAILTSASIAVMFTFVLPFFRNLLPGWELHWYANGITGMLTVLLIAPFLRAMVMKKNRSPEFRALWAESTRNRMPLIFTIVVRLVIAISFIFYICNYLSRFTNALMITIGVLVIMLIIFSRWVKHRSITLERLFVQNLRSREIDAQVHGKKRPLYADRLLDRDIHIADFEVPSDSLWMGKSLKELNLGQKYGVHVSSILRSGWRVNIPDGDFVIFPGDVLQAIGSDEQFSVFREALERERMGVDPDVEKRQMMLRQLVIGGDSPFVGKTLIESGIRDLYSCMVIGLEEGKQNLSAFPPHRKFQEGDIIWVVGEQESLNALLSV